MRTQILTLAMTATALATPVRDSDCPDCVLGLYADSLLTQTTVNPGGDSLVLWVGMRYGGFTPPELTGVEFSIVGLEPFTVTTHALGPPAIVLGEPAAPTGLDTLTLAGGVNAAWSYCVPGEQALLRLTLRPRTNWPQRALLRVTNRFPPSNPALRAPLFTQCDDPVFTTTTVRGGSFVVEHGRDPRCEVDAATGFGVALVGANLTLPITITNRGGGLLSGVVSEACDEFEIAATDLSYELGNLQSRTFDLCFRPTTPGIKTCTLALGSSCGDLTFTATVPELVTVAMIRHDIDAFADQIVTIEGQVIVPSTHRSPPLFGWLRDGSGRGIQVWAPGLTDLGDRWRVTARVTRADRSIRLQPIVFLDVLDGGHPPIAPTPLAMAALRDPIWSGDLVRVRGRAVQLDVLGDEWRYQLEDDTAEITLVVSSGRFPSPPFRVGDLVVATGAVEPAPGGGTLVYMRDGLAGACPGLGVTVADAQGSLGAILSVPLRTSGGAVPVDAFRLRIAYEPEVVRFRGASGCGVTADWTVGVDSVAPDTVLVWGQGGTPVPQFASETLACLDLEMVGCLPRRSRLVPHALADDVENAWACPGEVNCSDCPSTGDVNGDGTLTPGDAQCAFAIFMHEHMVPLDCDAAGGCELAVADFDCNGEVTPLDALEVFRSWLADQTTPRQCGVALARRPAAPRAAGGGVYRIDVDHARAAGGDRFEVDVERLELDGDTAFGADVRFDPARMQFVDFRAATGALGWPALDARWVGPGRVRVAGFAARAATSGPRATWTAIATLEFRAADGDAAFTGVEWLEAVVVEPQPQAAPSGIAFGRVYPNPTRTGVVTIDVGIPSGTASRVRAVVHDVRGRRVRVLHDGALAPGWHPIRWDRRDAWGEQVAAGIYVVELETDDRIERRKVVVVE